MTGNHMVWGSNDWGSFDWGSIDLDPPIAGYVPATLFIALCFAGCNRTLGVILFILIQGMAGCQYSGYKSSFVDLAPRYAAIVTGISCSFANLAGFSSTIIMEHLVDNNPSVLYWQYGFIIAASLYAVTTTIYLVSVDVEGQPWHIETTDHDEKEDTSGMILVLDSESVKRDDEV